MSEQKFPPRLLVTHRAFSGFQVSRLDHKIDKIHFEGTYVHITEHKHLMSENERRIERLREALKKIEHYQHGIPGTYSDPIVIARDVLQEDDK